MNNDLAGPVVYHSYRLLALLSFGYRIVLVYGRELVTHVDPYHICLFKGTTPTCVIPQQVYISRCLIRRAAFPGPVMKQHLDNTLGISRIRLLRIMFPR